MKKLFSALALSAGLIAAFAQIDACTGLKLTAKDGSVINGRTLEFGLEIEIYTAVIPRGYEFPGSIGNGKGMPYKAKYAVAGASAFTNPAILDGINEKGLSVGTFYFPTFAEYSKLTSENEPEALSPLDFPNWLLTQFATLDEVKAALANVVIVSAVDPAWGNDPLPLHYIVYDQKGNALTIEPIDGKLVTQNNPIGTFTNSPTFDWHMTNLRNYINLTPFNVKPVKLNGIEFESFGQGGGMVGLPGDFTPPSRFVRAAIFSATAIPSNTAQEAVFQVFHILNQFDIPVGAAQSKENGVVYSDYTQATCVKDSANLKYYIKTYDDQSIRMIDLKKVDLDAKSIKKAKTASKQTVIDMTAELK